MEHDPWTTVEELDNVKARGGLNDKMVLNLAKGYHCPRKRIPVELKQISWSDLFEPDVEDTKCLLKLGPRAKNAASDYVAERLDTYYQWCIANGFVPDDKLPFGCTIDFTTGEIKMHDHILKFIDASQQLKCT
jgi:hypothetical protein